MVQKNKLLSYDFTQADESTRLTELDFLQFSKLLEQVGNKQAWHEKWKVLCDTLTKKDTTSGPFYSCWIICQDHKYLRFVLNYNHWYSNITNEYCHKGGHKSRKGEVYAYIRIYEEGSADSKPVFNLRTDISGEEGELVWLQKGQSLTGVNIIQIFRLIERAFPTRVVYLHDDAKFTVESTLSLSGTEIQIKTLRAIALDYSWYESMRFEAMNVPDQCWLIKDVPKEFYVQNKKNYRDAIKLVQNTPIDVLKENFAQSDTLRNKWNNLFGNSMQAEENNRGRRSGSDRPWTRARSGARSKGFVEKTQIFREKKLKLIFNRKKNGTPKYIVLPCRRATEPRNVKDIVVNVYRNSRKTQPHLQQIVSNQNLSLLYDLFLTPQARHLKKPSKEYCEYANALDVIENTKLFARVEVGSVPKLKRLKHMPPPEELKRKAKPLVETPPRKKLKKNNLPKESEESVLSKSKQKAYKLKLRGSRVSASNLEKKRGRPASWGGAVLQKNRSRRPVQPARKRTRTEALPNASYPPPKRPVHTRSHGSPMVVDQVKPITKRKKRKHPNSFYDEVFYKALKEQPYKVIKKRKNSTSKYRGVHWSTSSCKWGAQWQKGGSKFLGSFTLEEEAAYRWDREANKYEEYEGELNFPNFKEVYDVEAKEGVGLKRQVIVEILKMYDGLGRTWNEISDATKLSATGCKKLHAFFQPYYSNHTNTSSQQQSGLNTGPQHRTLLDSQRRSQNDDVFLEFRKLFKANFDNSEQVLSKLNPKELKKSIRRQKLGSQRQRHLLNLVDEAKSNRRSTNKQKEILKSSRRGMQRLRPPGSSVRMKR